MKKILIIITIVTLFLNLHSQVIGVFGGCNANTNYYFYFDDNPASNYAVYSYRLGINSGISVDLLKSVYFPLRITCRLYNINGSIEEKGASPAGAYRFNGTYKKQNLSIGIQFFDVKPKTNIRFSLGGEYNTLLKEKFDGVSYWFKPNYINEVKILNENNFELNVKKTLSIIGNIGYEANITNELYIMPQLTLNIGLTKELNRIGLNITPRNLRFLFEIGIYKRLK